MSDAAKFWDVRAEKYSKSKISDMAAYDRTLDHVRTYLKPEDDVLELGCGTGSTALKLRDSVSSYLATDFSSGMIDIANRKLQGQERINIEFKTADVSSLLATGQQYDVLMAFNLLHLLPGLEYDLLKIKSLIKPGGLFISKTVCKPLTGMPFQLRMMMFVLPIMQAVGMAPFVKIRPINEFEQIIEKPGFEILETANYPASPPSRFIVAKC